ncbi:MAG: SulP family inorganic anion transporter [Deltaproteobacteria bacterium]|nr:SulP family inorganic anion transporter [Deltaproteobacteria bacterium]
MSARSSGLLAHARSDLPAGLVVFLVALPLCLGIAQASGAPLVSGLVAGVVGGVVVAALSGAALSVSGPAAGLAVIVATGIGELGAEAARAAAAQGADPAAAAAAGVAAGFPAFLLAVVLAGGLQVAMGALRLGAIAHFFPSAVIKGMLAAIGVLIILKQAPHAVGYDKEFVGSDSFTSTDGNTFSTLAHALNAFTPAAVLTSVLCIALMLGWPKLQRTPLLKLVPPALLAVVGGAAVAAALGKAGLVLEGEHMVALPASIADAIKQPAFARITDPTVWKVALTLAIVASLETLLSLEAVDRLDPDRRISPPNRELVAQGIGNVCSGLLGGLPITSVIVRSSANVQAGAKTRLSAIFHGLLLLAGVLFLAPLLNRVPLAALAVVLLFVGYKLTTPALWRAMYKAGPTQFIPFVVTIVAIVGTDLLKGTLVGVVVGLFFSVRAQQKNAVEVKTENGRTDVVFHKDMTFLQKARVKDVLREIPEGSAVVLDRRKVDHVDDDIEEVLDEYAREAPHRDIRLEVLWETGALARRDHRLARDGAGGH